MEKNKKIKLLIISSVLFLILAIGGVYAWLTFTTGNVIVAGNTHCFNINYTKGADITGNIGAIKEEDYVTGNTIKLSTAMGFTPISMELDKRCNKLSGIGVLELNVQNLSTAFTSEGNSYGSLKYVVAEYDPSLYTDSTIQYLKNQTFTYIRRGIVSETGTMDIHTEYLSPGEVHNYLVIIYLDKNMVGDDIIGASITATGTARVDQFVATPITDFTYATGTYNGITIPEGYVLLTSYNGTDTVVNVPSTYTINGTTYNVMVYSDTSNNTSTFGGNTTITEVNFADGVSFYVYDGTDLIENSANSLFKGCTSLISAPKLPNTITNMDSTYEGCTSLTNVKYLPTSINSMLGTFKNCSNLSGYIRIVGEDVEVDSNTFSGISGNIVVEVPANSDTYDNIAAIAPNNIEVEQIGLVDPSTPITDFLYVIGTGEKITSIPIYTYSDCLTSNKNPTYETKETFNYTLPLSISLESNEILLTGYTGSSTDIYIPDTYTIDGTTYNVVMLSYMPLDSCTLIPCPPEEAGGATKTGYNFDNVVASPLGYSNGDYEARFMAGSVCTPSSAVSYEAPAYCGNYGLLLNNDLVSSIYIGDNVIPMAYTSETDYRTLQLSNSNNNFYKVSPLAIGKTENGFYRYSMLNAFWDNSNLVNVTNLPNYVTDMEGTFKGCTSLNYVADLPSYVVNMNYTFLNCSSLVNSPSLGSSVQYMEGTYAMCSSLVSSPVIPSSVTEITSLFYNCSSLEGTVTFNTSQASRTADNCTYGRYPFYGTVNNITAVVPGCDTTRSTINSGKLENITISVASGSDCDSGGEIIKK